MARLKAASSWGRILQGRGDGSGSPVAASGGQAPLGQGALVALQISFGGPLPGEVFLHGAALDLAPPVLIRIECQGGAGGVKEIKGGELIELKAGAGFRAEHDVRNGIIESAHSVHHWNGAVAKAVHLIQTAGFELGGMRNRSAP